MGQSGRKEPKTFTLAMTFLFVQPCPLNEAMEDYDMRQLKAFIAVTVVFGALVSANIAPAAMNFSYVQQAMAADDTGMGKVSLLLKKLRASMASIKDLDELEKAGMSKRDVDRMRRAMQQKIQQLTDEAVASIHAL